MLPIGMAYHEATGWLLVAEAGINAVGVIDTRQIEGARPSAGGLVSQPRADRRRHRLRDQRERAGHRTECLAARDFAGEPRRFHRHLPARQHFHPFRCPMPRRWPRRPQAVMENNGLQPAPGDAPGALPGGVKYVVLIVKENRTFDEVFGDIQRLANGHGDGCAAMARFGRMGYAAGKGSRLSLQRVNVTPNHHAMALRWSFSDNFYADSEVSVDGHHWLVGSYPDAWTETSFRGGVRRWPGFPFPDDRAGTAAVSRKAIPRCIPEEQPEGGTIWHHLARHGISFRNYGEGFELAGVRRRHRATSPPARAS